MIGTSYYNDRTTNTKQLIFCDDSALQIDDGKLFINNKNIHVDIASLNGVNDAFWTLKLITNLYKFKIQFNSYKFDQKDTIYINKNHIFIYSDRCRKIEGMDNWRTVHGGKLIIYSLYKTQTYDIYKDGTGFFYYHKDKKIKYPTHTPENKELEKEESLYLAGLETQTAQMSK